MYQLVMMFPTYWFFSSQLYCELIIAKYRFYNTCVSLAAIRIELGTESTKPFGKIVVLHVMLKEFSKTCLIYFQSIYFSLNNFTIQNLVTGIYSYMIICC